MKLKTKVLVTQPIHPKGMELLKNNIEEVILAPNDKIETLLKLLDDSVTGVVVRYNIFNRELMDKAPNLKVIARHGIGVELIDLAAATEKGIMVVNTPDAATVSVAEHVVMLILALSKKLIYADRELKKGNYVKDEYISDDVQNKVLGLVGFGRISREVAKRCLCLGMEVIAFDPFVDKEKFVELNVKKIESFDHLLLLSDFVSMHTPLTDQTRNMISDAQFELMGPNTYFINCSRGNVVDEEALIRALQQNRIAGAGLDVFSKEPPDKDNPLFKLENVILTPHSSSLTENGKIKMAVGAENNY